MEAEERKEQEAPAPSRHDQQPTREQRSARSHPFMQHRHPPQFRGSQFREHALDVAATTSARSRPLVGSGDAGPRTERQKEDVTAFLSSISSGSSAMRQSDLLSSPTRPPLRAHVPLHTDSAKRKARAARDRREYRAFLSDQLRLIKADGSADSAVEFSYSSSPSSPLRPPRPTPRGINWTSLEAQAAQLQAEWMAMQRDSAQAQLQQEIEQQLAVLSHAAPPPVPAQPMSEAERLRSDVISRVHAVEAEWELTKEEAKRDMLAELRKEASAKLSVLKATHSDGSKESRAAAKGRKEGRKEESYPFLSHLQQLFSAQSAVVFPSAPAMTSAYLPTSLSSSQSAASSPPIVIVTPPQQAPFAPTLPPPAMSFTSPPPAPAAHVEEEKPVERAASVSVQAEEDWQRDAATDTNPSLWSTARPAHTRQPSVASSPALSASLTSASFPHRVEQTASYPPADPARHHAAVQHSPAVLPQASQRPVAPASLAAASLSVLDQAHSSVQSRLHAHTAAQEQSTVLSALESLLEMKRRETGRSGSAEAAVKGVEYAESGLLSLLLRAFELGDDRGVDEEWLRVVQREEADESLEAERRRKAEEDERARRELEEKTKRDDEDAQRRREEEEERRKQERKEEQERLLAEMERRVEERLRKEKDEEAARRKDEEDKEAGRQRQREAEEEEQQRRQEQEEAEARRRELEAQAHLAALTDELRAKHDAQREAEAERVERDRKEAEARRAEEDARVKALADAEAARLLKKKADEEEIERVRVQLMEEKDEWERARREEQRAQEMRMIAMLKAEVEALKQQKVQMDAAHGLAEGRLANAARRRAKNSRAVESDQSELSSGDEDEEEEEEEEDDEESGSVSSHTDDTASSSVGRSDGEVGAAQPMLRPVSGYRSPGTFSPAVSLPPSPGHLMSSMLAKVAQPLSMVRGAAAPRPRSTYSTASSSRGAAKYGDVHVPPSPGQVVTGTQRRNAEAKSAARERYQPPPPVHEPPVQNTKTPGLSTRSGSGPTKGGDVDEDDYSDGELSRSGLHIFMSGSFVPFGSSSMNDRAAASSFVPRTAAPISTPPETEYRRPTQTIEPVPLATAPAAVSPAVLANPFLPVGAAHAAAALHRTTASSASASASGWESELERAQHRVAAPQPLPTTAAASRTTSKPHTPPRLPPTHSRTPTFSVADRSSAVSAADPSSPSPPRPVSVSVLVSQWEAQSHPSSSHSSPKPQAETKSAEEDEPAPTKPNAHPSISAVHDAHSKARASAPSSRRSSGLMREVKRFDERAVENVFEREERERKERESKYKEEDTTHEQSARLLEGADEERGLDDGEDDAGEDERGEEEDAEIEHSADEQWLDNL